MAISVTMEESDAHQAQVRITSRLIDSLYTEAMLLADEARSYFDDAGRDERRTLEPFARVEGRRPERRLGNAQDSDPLVVNQLPLAAQKLINSSSDLYARIKRIDEGSAEDEAPQSPARALMGRLERGLGGHSV